MTYTVVTLLDILRTQWAMKDELVGHLIRHALGVRTWTTAKLASPGLPFGAMMLDYRASQRMRNLVANRIDNLVVGAIQHMMTRKLDELLLPRAQTKPSCSSVEFHIPTLAYKVVLIEQIVSQGYCGSKLHVTSPVDG